MRLILCLICIVSCLQPVLLTASSTEYKFKHLSIDNGLSKNTIHDFTQDDNGHIWVATYNGLNRFDGHSIRIFRNDPEDKASICGNLVTTVEFDGVSSLWIGTSDGLSIYNISKDTFDNRQSDSHIEDLELLDEESALIATVDSLIIYNKSEGSSQRLEYRGKDIIAYSLAKGKQGIYIGTWNQGLLLYSTEEHTIATVPSPLSDIKINCIHCMEGEIWVGTEGKGLYCIDTKSGEIRRYTKENGEIIDNMVRSLTYSKGSGLWVGTVNGLTILNQTDATTTHLTHDSFIQGSLSHNSIRSMFIDDQEGIWIGTYFGGVNYWHPLSGRFGHIRRLPDGSSLSDNVTSCITEDRHGNIWIGTNKGGLNRIMPDGKFRHYTLPISNDVKAVYADDSRTIYIGAHGSGLNLMDLSNGRIRHIEESPDDVYSLTRRDDSSIWVGSFKGLYSFDIPSERLNKVQAKEISDIRILSMFADRDTLWIGAEEGLFAYDTHSDIVISDIPGPLKSLSYVHCFFESSENQLWIATIKGLFKWDGKNLIKYTMKDGLSSDSIHGIEEDSFGRIWVSTDNGLNCLNPNTGVVRRYFVNDGLQSNEFNAYSHCHLSSGNMMFGGIGGITVFKPENLMKNTWARKPTITRVESGGKTINTCTDIVLNHRSNSLTLTFSVPNYPSWGKNTFAYMLEGIDKDWIRTSSPNTVSYPNIPKGKYKFHLKAANGDDLWNEETVTLNITVLPPWYNTILAHVLFSIILLTTLWFLLQSYIERKNIKNKLELDRLEKEHREEMHQMKTNFIINTSHELRTPLTLILAPLSEMLTRSTDLWMNRQIKGIERNAKRLLKLTNQLLDLKHADLGIMKLNVRQENVFKIVNDCFSFYKALANMKHIRYTMFSDIENQLLYVDSEYLELILNSLLSNAFKHTDKGLISVGLTVVEEHLRLEVNDTGIGMTDESESNNGAELLLIRRLVELHHGRMDITSKKGEGSRFVVDFPQSLDAYSADELKDNISPLVNLYEEPEEDYHDNTLSPEKTQMYGKILIVENDHELTKFLAGRLAKVFDVMTASNGEEARTIIDNDDIDLVIAEEIMPSMGGVKLCQVIKQNFRTSQIPVFIITAKNDTSDHMDFLLAGADDFIIKPFSLRILLAKAKNIIRLKRRTLENYTKAIAITPEKLALTPHDEEFMNRINDIVTKHLSDPDFSTETFARLMNMSRANLHIKMKSITGESTLDYINMMRFSEACRLLKEGKHTISEISDMVGFSSSSYFTARFRKFIGYTPTEYANQHKGLRIKD